MDKILITDSVPQSLINKLCKLGFKVSYLPNISYNKLRELISDVDILIVRGRLKIDREIISRAIKLKKIIRFGVGLDNIDVNFAKTKGILVYNTPMAFTESVAELTLAFIIGVLRGIGNAHYNMKKGLWIKSKLIGRELYGKNVGIIGFGRIGKRVYELLKPFNVKVFVYDIIKIPEKYIKEGVTQVENLFKIAENADIITIHVPLTEKTKGMIDEEFLSKCKDGVVIINTSRGEIIDKNALLKYIKLGKVYGIALDVYWEEPFKDSSFLDLENTLFTPHIGAQTYEARERAVDEVIKIITQSKA